MSTATLDADTVRRWKRCSEHQPLALDWKLSIPAHWKARRLKEVASVRPSNVDKKSVEGERQVRLCNYVDVYKHDRITADMDFMAATATDSQISQFSIRAGDVIVTKDSETWDDIAVPAYVPETIAGLVCGYHLALIRPDARRLDGAYLARCFAARGLREQFHVAANGIIRYGLDTQSIRCAVMPVPPLAEQRLIAAFLDRETARIDALVERKERLIELLEEKRQAVISHAVTRGLDPTVSLKNSGIPWLGMAPAHWRPIRLKHLSMWITSGSRGWAEYYSDEGPLFLRIGNLSRSSPELKLNDIQRVSPPQGAEGARTRVQAGDLLVSITAYLGAVGVIPDGFEEAYVNQHLALVRPLRAVVEPWWLGYFLLSDQAQTQFPLLNQGGTKEGLSLGDVGDLVILVPPPREQASILDFIRRAEAPLDDACSRIRDGIARLHECRTALISAAVTGQIDVRGEVSP